MAVEDYMNAGAESEAPEGEAEAPENEGEESESEKALINSSVCPGMAVGDTLELTITAVRDGEYEVEYSESESPDEESEEEAPPERGEGPSSYMED